MYSLFSGHSPGDSEDNKDLYDFINQLATAFSVRYAASKNVFLNQNCLKFNKLHLLNN